MSESTRRKKGSGSIRQEAPDRWIASVRYGHNDKGNPHTKKFVCKSEAEAKRKLREFTKQLASPDFIVTGRQSVERFMLTWLNTVKKNQLKPTSFDRLELTLNKDIIPYIGHLQVGALTGQDIQKLLNDADDRGVSYYTIKKAYDAIHGCLEWGVVQRQLQFNASAGVVVPGSRASGSRKKKSDKLRVYTKEEQKKLIEAALETYPNGTPIYRFGYAIPFLLNTGLRIGELIALRWDRDIDLEARTVHVCHNAVVVKDRENGGVKLLEQDSTKSDAGDRFIYLNNVAMDALAHLKEIDEDGVYVCSSKNGKPLHPSNLERMMRNLCKKAEFGEEKSYGVHALRHSFASNLFAADVDIKTISELLGHADVGITMNTYVHLLDDSKKKAVVKIMDLT